MDLFGLKKKRRQQALIVQLADTPEGMKTSEHLTALYQSYDETAIAEILKKKPFKKSIVTEKEKRFLRAHETARLLHKMKVAEAALNDGNIHPVVALADDGHYQSYTYLTRDLTNKTALRAKASLWKREEYCENGELHYTQNRVNFARNHLTDAIDAFSALGMINECTAAMNDLKTNWNSEIDNREQYWAQYLKQLREGKPENHIKGAIAASIKMAQTSTDFFDYKMTLDDYKAVLQYHHDDAQKVIALEQMTNREVYNGIDYEEIVAREKEIIVLLLDHSKTQGKEPTASQAKAIEIVVTKHDMVIEGDCSRHGPDMHRLFYNTAIDELNEGSPHYLKHVFPDRGAIYNVVLGHWRFQGEQEHNQIPVVPSDLIATYAKGHGAAKGRLHLATVLYSQATGYYKGGSDACSELKPEYVRDMHTAAQFTAEVLADDSVTDKSIEGSAKKLMERIILEEDYKTERDERDYPEELNRISNKYDDWRAHDRIENLDKRRNDNQSVLGAGVDALNKIRRDGGERVSNLISEITKSVNEQWMVQHGRHPKQSIAKIIKPDVY